MVKMRKLDNAGKPFIHEGEEVIREFDNLMADKIQKLNGAKWEVVEDDRNKKTEPQAARTETPEEPKAEVKKTTKKKASKKK